MNLIKTSMALAIAACCAAPAVAASAVTPYGKVNLSVESADVSGSRELGLTSNASRFGLKGGTDLSDTLQVVYQFEFQVNIDDDDSETLGKRNQFVGLKGGFGQVLLGRNDTLLKQSQGKFDLFNDLQGDIKKLGFKGENRLGETVTYQTPSFNGVKLGATLALEGSSKQAGETGYSLAAMYGDSKLKKSPLYAALAYDSDVAGYDIIRATLQGKIADFTLGAMYQSQEAVGGESQNGFAVNAAYQWDTWTAKLQYQELEEANSYSLGADYKLAKPTKLFAFYTATDKNDADYIGIGVEHKF